MNLQTDAQTAPSRGGPSIACQELDFICISMDKNHLHPNRFSYTLQIVKGLRNNERQRATQVGGGRGLDRCSITFPA